MLNKIFVMACGKRLLKNSTRRFSMSGIKTGKKGKVFIKSTNRNIFCTLLNLKDDKVITSCSLRVPAYENKFNEREDLFERGRLLGELFGDKILGLGFVEVGIFLDHGLIKGRRGVVKGLGDTQINISFIELLKGYPHNGCRPPKSRHKKLRTKPKLR